MAFKIDWTETNGEAKTDSVATAKDALLMCHALEIQGLARITVKDSAGHVIKRLDLERLAMA